MVWTLHCEKKKKKWKDLIHYDCLTLIDTLRFQCCNSKKKKKLLASATHIKNHCAAILTSICVPDDRSTSSFPHISKSLFLDYHFSTSTTKNFLFFLINSWWSSDIEARNVIFVLSTQSQFLTLNLYFFNKHEICFFLRFVTKNTKELFPSLRKNLATRFTAQKIILKFCIVFLYIKIPSLFRRADNNFHLKPRRLTL